MGATMRPFELTAPEGTKGKRRVNDAYYTPPKLAAFLVGLMNLHPGSTVLEPSAGGGSFVRALKARDHLVCAIDIDPDAAGLMHADQAAVQDFADPLAGLWPRFDAVVGNPPFALAKEHIDRALEVVRPGGRVGFLLRLAFLETVNRFQWWRANPPRDIYVLAERVSFTGGGSDNAAYAFFVWHRKDDVTEDMWPASLHLVSWKAPDLTAPIPPK